jgi:hypothetical protein
VAPRFGLIASLVLGASLTGCNSKGLVPVEGRVTFVGKDPQTVGYLYFVPREMSTDKLQDRTGPLTGTAQFGLNGFFRGTTFRDGDGLRPGTYEVRLQCEGRPAGHLSPEQAHDAPRRSLVPRGFAAPDLVVPTSGPRPVRYDLDVPAERPRQ